ncbi:MAG: hypothetical protein EP332_01880 [Bacteroidetes bacterium]|nr:MAG: hypothetical protein EP332_01880 [Bacteroidota bacterium]
MQKLKFMDGTVLNIPANALCMKDGSDVKDPIQVAYMPLDNAFDVMLSGIPMTYDSAGGQSLFQTAGMFRLEAKTNKGEEVVLKDGKAMNIAMPTVDTGGRYNDYRFDEQSGIWKFQETSVSAYNSFVRVENSKESESLDYLFFNKDYAYTYSTENRLTPTNLCVNHSRKHNSCRIHEPYNIKPSRIKTIYFKTQTVRNAEDKTKSIYFTAEKPDYYWAFNPEWRVFNNWKFKSIDYTESKEFRLAYKGGKRYNDMRLIWDGKSNDVLLLLKHGGGMDSLHAEAWDLNDRKAFQLRRTFARKYRRYQRELNKREECHRANMRRFQTQTDRMKLVQTRPMVLPGFGIYNCDRTYLMASPRRYTKLEYTTAEGLLIMPSQIIVLDEKARGAFFLNSMSFNACTKGTVAVLTSDTSGNMLACSGKHLAQYGSYKGGKRLSFQVVPDEVKEYTALQNWLESLSEE